ncbi:TetR/AcrR family transcriptional regulator [uncultured Alsobacter sp.]|uniref:TetR/AcrR family transcriptional regulator n=1 Tax=uncultured Alsobacter sp. TaxID=1748258 RepID=UPI0025DFA080|nr:TetR/AcrR family transcriptional regulator [uncultured Alsobacter sp.]
MRDGARTRDRILHEALALFAERGIDGTSVRDIAQAVGVAEAALYRHFRSKDEIARDLFLVNYAALAADVLAIGAQDERFAIRLEKLVGLFARLFDENPALFAFLLINQHRHLAEVDAAPGRNPVAAVALVLREAIERRDIPPQDPDLAAAMALGLVVQPAVFHLYGRLTGPLSARVPAITAATGAVLGTGRS